MTDRQGHLDEAIDAIGRTALGEIGDALRALKHDVGEALSEEYATGLRDGEENGKDHAREARNDVAEAVPEILSEAIAAAWARVHPRERSDGWKWTTAEPWSTLTMHLHFAPGEAVAALGLDV